MSKKSINLLVDTSGSNYAKLLNKLRVLRILAMGLLFLVGTSSVMLFLMIAFSPLPRLREEEARLTRTISSGEYQIKMDKYFVISSRLKDINTVLKQRPDIVKTYELIEETLAGSVRINFIDITEKNVALNLFSTNLFDLQTVVDNMQAIPADSSFRSLTLTGISYDAFNNEYEMVVLITL